MMHVLIEELYVAGLAAKAICVSFTRRKQVVGSLSS